MRRPDLPQFGGRKPLDAAGGSGPTGRSCGWYRSTNRHRAQPLDDLLIRQRCVDSDFLVLVALIRGHVVRPTEGAHFRAHPGLDCGCCIRRKVAGGGKNPFILGKRPSWRAVQKDTFDGSRGIVQAIEDRIEGGDIIGVAPTRTPTAGTWPAASAVQGDAAVLDSRPSFQGVTIRPQYEIVQSSPPEMLIATCRVLVILQQVHPHSRSCRHPGVGVTGTIEEYL